MIFKDRRQAGKLLADKLTVFNNKDNVVVVGITRGGIVVEGCHSIRFPKRI